MKTIGKYILAWIVYGALKIYPYLKIPAKILLVLAPLAMIGYGAWTIYPPAGFISVGALLWFDLFTMRPQRREIKK